MIPLTQVEKRKSYTIKDVKGTTDTNRFFANIGCSIGDDITVISKIANNYVVQIKDGRFGIDKRFAKKILVEKQ